MSAGTYRSRSTTGFSTPFGTFSLPIDWAQSVDEVFGPHIYEVATGITEQLVPAMVSTGLTTVECLAIVSDQNISVTLGAAGTNDPIQLNANAPLILGGTSLTAVSISNSSGSTALVSCLFGGT